jgi:anti-anti-sigma factor
VCLEDRGERTVLPPRWALPDVNRGCVGRELKLMESSEARRGEVWFVVQVWGEPRAYNVDSLESVLATRTKVAGCRLLVRLEDARTLDSTAFALLMSAFKRIEQGGGNFRLEVTEPLKQLFRRFGKGGGDGGLGGVLAPLAPPPSPNRGAAAAEPPVDTGE